MRIQSPPSLFVLLSIPHEKIDSAFRQYRSSGSTSGISVIPSSSNARSSVMGRI
jgi:hypothetical protein